MSRAARAWSASMADRAPAIDPAIVNDYAERGRALVAAGHDAAALEAFQRAAWMSPDDPRLHWAVGNVLWRLGRGEEAVASYRRVIELLPDEAAPRCNLAELYAVLGRVQDAQLQLLNARAFAPHDPHLHLADAVIALARRRPAAAEEAARKAVASGVLPKFAYLDLGDALLAQGRGADALAAYRQARSQAAAADLLVMRQDLAWLASVYRDLPHPTYQQALALFSA
jgi:Flp pilus assembly protein TadD